MSDDEKHMLDLDELFGQARGIKVIWEKAEYQLTLPEAFGARETMRLSALHRKAGALQMLDDLTPEQAQELERLLDEILRILCQELPVGEIPFVAKLRALTFYAFETKKNALRAALEQIGATPSAG